MRKNKIITIDHKLTQFIMPKHYWNGKTEREYERERKKRSISRHLNYYDTELSWNPAQRAYKSSLGCGAIIYNAIWLKNQALNYFSLESRIDFSNRRVLNNIQIDPISMENFNQPARPAAVALQNTIRH